jgi:hypothetical protein
LSEGVLILIEKDVDIVFHANKSLHLHIGLLDLTRLALWLETGGREGEQREGEREREREVRSRAGRGGRRSTLFCLSFSGIA